MREQTIQIKKEDAIVQITLDRPKANAINKQMSEELYKAIKDFNEDDSMRVAIITGRGDKFFSAGWDLKSNEDLDTDYGPGGFAGITEFYDIQKPIIAAVNGIAAGGGFELSLACDIILAAEDAEFFLPEANIGIIPDAGGVLRLPKAIPQKVAMDMLLTGRKLTAEEGVHHGLIKQTTSRENLLDEAYTIAKQLSESAPLSIQAIKEVVQHTAHLPIKEGYEKMRSGELKAYHKMLQSNDAVEGPTAFAEKRKPNWSGT